MRKTRTLRTLSVVPRLPLPFYALWGVAQVLGLTLTREPSTYTILFADLTKIPRGMFPRFSESWINGRCTDISKTHVAKIFSRISGRSLVVDPFTHHGPMVEKSEENGFHNGRIVRGPLTKVRAGYAYQRLIDNRDDDRVEDLRTVVVGSTIPFVYRKFEPLSRRFAGGSIATDIVETTSVFSDAEQRLILEMSDAIGLDFGEVDVLRDRTDGQMYVVDVNKTSVSPPIGLTYEERLSALQRIANAFEREFMGEAAASQLGNTSNRSS